ncbi:MAG: phosphatase PAP2 family protein [Fusicatenibacter sp.]|nr:phosphatase PAP2 family protein [Fusicatenibacter sp.]
MAIGRTIAGVHWLTDSIGSVILSTGLYLIYKSSVYCTSCDWWIKGFAQSNENKKGKENDYGYD